MSKSLVQLILLNECFYSKVFDKTCSSFKRTCYFINIYIYMNIFNKVFSVRIKVIFKISFVFLATKHIILLKLQETQFVMFAAKNKILLTNQNQKIETFNLTST